MANILGTQTVGKLLVITTDTNPTLAGGTSAPVGSIALTADGSGTFTKTGVANTDWTPDTGSGSSPISGDIELDFGDLVGGDKNATVTVSSLLVTDTNFKSFSFIPKSNTDHDLDDFVAEGITFNIQNIQDNVSFDIVASAPNNSWGKYKITYKIII